MSDQFRRYSSKTEEKRVGRWRTRSLGQTAPWFTSTLPDYATSQLFPALTNERHRKHA